MILSELIKLSKKMPLKGNKEATNVPNLAMKQSPWGGEGGSLHKVYPDIIKESMYKRQYINGKIKNS